MRIISLYSAAAGYVLESSSELLSRANQASPPSSDTSPAWTRSPIPCPPWRSRTWSPSGTPPSCSQRLEMVRRIADEIVGYVVELGTDGRLLALQLDELMAGVDADRELVVRDYLPAGRKARTLDDGHRRTGELSRDRTARPRRRSARALGLRRTPRIARRRGQPRAATGCWPGCPGCPSALIDRVVEQFGGLQKLLGGERRGTAGRRRAWARRGRGPCGKPSPGWRMHR